MARATAIPRNIDQKRPRASDPVGETSQEEAPSRAAHSDRAQQEDGGGSRNAMIESVGNEVNERDKNAKRGRRGTRRRDR